MINYTIFLSIDPGKSAGGIVIEKDGKAEVFKVPKTIEDLDKLLRDNIDNPEETLCFLERLSVWSGDNAQGKQFRIGIMLDHYSQLKTILTLAKIKFATIDPKSWQKGLNLTIKGVKEEKPARKKRYQAAAKDWYPEIKVTLWNADALLIHKFMKFKFTNDPKWVEEVLKK